MYLSLVTTFLRTESRKDCGLGAAGFSDHNGNRWVGLLHGGIASGEEVPVSLRQLKFHSQPPNHAQSRLRLPSLKNILYRGSAYLVAALCSLVWQNRKRSSLSPFPNTFEAIARNVGVKIVCVKIVCVKSVNWREVSSPSKSARPRRHSMFVELAPGQERAIPKIA